MAFVIASINNGNVDENCRLTENEK